MEINNEYMYCYPIEDERGYLYFYTEKELDEEVEKLNNFKIKGYIKAIKSQRDKEMNRCQLQSDAIEEALDLFDKYFSDNEKAKEISNKLCGE